MASRTEGRLRSLKNHGMRSKPVAKATRAISNKSRGRVHVCRFALVRPAVQCIHTMKQALIVCESSGRLVGWLPPGDCIVIETDLRLSAWLIRFSQGWYWRTFMRGFPVAIAAPMLSALSIIVCASSAAAISAGLANKCRDMAIKSHPPPFPLGNKAYAQAERDFFRSCVAKKGQMSDSDAPNSK
jgi:hypothetical protein